MILKGGGGGVPQNRAETGLHIKRRIEKEHPRRPPPPFMDPRLDKDYFLVYNGVYILLCRL